MTSSAFQMPAPRLNSTMLEDQSERIGESVRAIQRVGEQSAQVAIILGSGLGGFADSLDIDASIPYSGIPHFVCSTAPGHAGRLILGRLADIPVLVMQGRCHLYEGYNFDEITYPIHVLQALGVETLILSCAAGGLAPDLRVGELLIIRDHLNLQFQNFGLRSYDQRQPSPFVYDPALSEQLISLASRLEIPARVGTYLGVTGPNYETRSELRFLRKLGTAVGMSTIAEATVARQLGMSVCALATITNLCNPEQPEQTDGDHVVQAATRAEPRFRKLVTEFLGQFALPPAGD